MKEIKRWKSRVPVVKKLPLNRLVKWELGDARKVGDGEGEAMTSEGPGGPARACQVSDQLCW